MTLLRHIKPLEELLPHNNSSVCTSSKPTAARQLVRLESKKEAEKRSSNQKYAAAMVARYLHQMRTLQNLEVAVASRLRRRILLLINSYSGMSEKLLSQASGVLKRRYEFRTEAAEISEQLREEDMDNF